MLADAPRDFNFDLGETADVIVRNDVKEMPTSPPTLARVPDAEDDNFVGARHMRVAHDIGGAAERHDEFAHARNG